MELPPGSGPDGQALDSTTGLNQSGLACGAFAPRTGGTAAAKAAERLLMIFIGLGVAVLAYASWAVWFSGEAVPPVPIALHQEGTTVTGTATVSLTTAMNPLRLNLAGNYHSQPGMDLTVQVHDPHDALVFTSSSAISADKSEPDRILIGSSGLGFIDVKQNGEYRITCRWELKESGPGLQSAELRLRRNASGSNFFFNSFIVFGAALVAGWRWWRRFGAEFWSRAAPAAPPVLVGGNPGSMPGRASTPGLSPPRGTPRLITRVALEGLALLLSFARLPIIGAYGMLALIGAGWLFGGLAPASLNAVMQSPLVARVLTWAYPNGHYEGMEALLATGRAIGTVTLAVYLVTLPFRLLRPPRPTQPFGRKARRFLQVNLIFFAVFALGLPFVNLSAGTSRWGALAVFAILTAVVFVPALALLVITTVIEHAIDRLGSRSPSTAGESLRVDSRRAASQ